MMARMIPETTYNFIWKLGEKFHEKNGRMASSIPWRQFLKIGIWKLSFDMVLLAGQKWLMDL